MNKEYIISEVEKIVSPVYLVGGSVRDIIIGREPKDWDFCTPLLPDDIEAKVKENGRRAYISGKKFGTVGFTIPNPDRRVKATPIEVTTFRAEQYQVGSRKPSEVQFVEDLQLDLSRRDFTINAIALKDGEYFDPYGGRLDILAKKIKSVGSSIDRFKEDPLRMLRAARFSSQLDFEIDPNMIGAIRKMPHTILTVSRERWMLELDKLLIADGYERGLDYLHNSYLLRYILPEVEALYNLGLESYIYDLIESKEATIEARWAGLLSLIGLPPVYKDADTFDLAYRQISPEMIKGIALRLKWSNDRADKVLELVKKSKF